MEEGGNEYKDVKCGNKDGKEHARGGALLRPEREGVSLLEQTWNKEIKKEIMKHSLRPEREGGAGDGRGQLEALDDLLPQLLVDDVDEAAARHHQVVQLVQVQDLLGHDGQAVDGRPCGGDGRLGLLREASHGRPRSGGAVHVLRDHPHPW